MSENSGAIAGLLSRHFPGQPALALVAQMSLNPPSYLLLHIVSRECCEQSTHIKDKLWADIVSLQKDVVAPQAQQQSLHGRKETPLWGTTFVQAAKMAAVFEQ